MTGAGTIIQNHSLAIGTLSTECTVLASPDQQPALQNLFERVVASALPAALSRTLDSVLEGLDGIIRIRKLTLNVEYIGSFDQAALTHILAIRMIAALRDALRNQNNDMLRHWPDQAAYLAAYIEYRLTLSHNPTPAWAFEEFATLDHLPPERAAAEMVRKFPEILISLAQNAVAENDPVRFARMLDEASARALVDALLDLKPQQIKPDKLATAFQWMDTNLRQLAITEPARAILSLTLILLTQADKPQIDKTLNLATLTTALLHLNSNKNAQGTGFCYNDTSTTAPTAEATHHLSPTIMAVINKHLKEPGFRQRLEAIMPNDLPAVTPNTEVNNTPAEATPVHLHSPIAGIGLLLPIITELCLSDYLTPRHLHDAILSILDPDQQTHAITDPVFTALFPFDRHDADQSIPTVPEALKIRIAPETLPLLTSNDVNAWGNLTLAAFATRLPGLRASSRGYLQRQFLHTPGRLTLAKETLELTLQGPDLSIILKMAGFNGVQRKIPHLGNRLLLITLARLA